MTRMVRTESRTRKEKHKKSGSTLEWILVDNRPSFRLMRGKGGSEQEHANGAN